MPNTDPSFANNLTGASLSRSFLRNESLTKTAFLDANEAVWENGIDTGRGRTVGDWNTLFRTALKLEIALFASAFQD